MFALSDHNQDWKRGHSKPVRTNAALEAQASRAPNRIWQSLAMRSASIQRKLSVNQPNDAYEQEADRVADRIASSTEPQLQRACACGGDCAECALGSDDRRGPVQTKRIQPRDATKTTVQRQETAASPAEEEISCAKVRPEFKFGTRVRFGQNQVFPLPGQEALLAKMVAEAKGALIYQLHGNASQEGSPAHNLKLSCRRAEELNNRLARDGVTTTPALFAHGATTLYGDKDIDNRNVVLVTTPKPKQEQPPPKEEKPPKKEEVPKPDEPPKVPADPKYSTSSCQDTDVTSIIRPADARAREMLDVARRVINEDPPRKELKDLYLDYFATSKPNLPAIKSVFGRLITAFSGSDYTWQCRYDCEKNLFGVTKCNSAFDIGCYGNMRLCMNNLKARPKPIEATAGTMVHEMGHRKFDFDDHAYCNSGPETCTGCPADISDEEALKNPDSYACFAQEAWNKFK